MVYAPTSYNRSVYAPLPSVAPGFRSPRSFRCAPFPRHTPPTFCQLRRRADGVCTLRIKSTCLVLQQDRINRFPQYPNRNVPLAVTDNKIRVAGFGIGDEQRPGTAGVFEGGGLEVPGQGQFLQNDSSGPRLI
jgi:hypothetical protein